VDEILLTVENVLKSELAMNYITFSGNGAATLHPQFAKIVREVVALRDKYRAGTPVAILSNSTGLDGYEVLDAFKLFDLAIMKLDCGEEKIFRKLNRPRRGFKLQDLISIIKSMRGITLQTIFVDGEVANFSGKALEKWQEAVAEIAPESVQIYTLDRDLPEMGLKMVKKEILMHIAEDTNKNTGILVKSFGENL
jgi:wyosine [tRNA(Phe)-imidazoG37] synthetase (radical SAM superfamily)